MPSLNFTNCWKFISFQIIKGQQTVVGKRNILITNCNCENFKIENEQSAGASFFRMPLRDYT